MSTPISIIGTVATAPRLSRTSSQVAFCTFRVASNERRYDRGQGQWVDGETNWFTVNAFRSLAEHASDSFSKGDRVVVHGRVRMRRWEAGEKSGTVVEVEADALGHDLRWGVSRFTKRSPAEQSSSASDAAAPAQGFSELPPPGPGEAPEGAAAEGGDFARVAA